jgi:phosphatidylserine decarboxylase
VTAHDPDAPTLMRIDRAGYPFIAGALLPAAALAVGRRTGLAAACAGVAGFLAFFFRDPDRQVPADDDLVVSPADGRVLVAGPPEPGAAPPGEWQQVSVFLSPMDVHINRIPFGGRILRVHYQPGRFLPAYQPDAARDNERSEIWIQRGDVLVVARQIVGILARRVVCRASEGDELPTGARFGLMKFGSRMDVFLPPHAQLQVEAGTRVRGGESVLARIPDAPAAPRQDRSC